MVNQYHIHPSMTLNYYLVSQQLIAIICHPPILFFFLVCLRDANQAFDQNNAPEF